MAKVMHKIYPLLLITIIAIFLVELFYFPLDHLIFKQNSSQELSSTVPSQPQKKVINNTKKHNPSIIIQRNLFHATLEGNKHQTLDSQMLIDSLNKTNLGLALLGTVEGIEDDDRAIIVSSISQKQEMLKEGDSIENAIIKKILRGKVIITVNGKDELLDMSENNYSLQQLPSPLAVSASPVLRQPKVLASEEHSDPDKKTRKIKVLPPKMISKEQTAKGENN